MSRKRSARNKDLLNSAGFTLLELLIAISLLALIVAFIVGSLRFGRRAWEVADRLDDTTSLVAAQHYLRDMLASAEPIGIPNAQGRLRLVFQGDDDRLVVVANLEGHTTKAGLYKITLGLHDPGARGDSARNAFVVNMRLFRPALKDEALAKPLEERELVANVKGLHFRYFGRSPETDEAAWHTDWTDQSKLPQLISVVVSFDDSDLRHWPDLIVGPQLH